MDIIRISRNQKTPKKMSTIHTVIGPIHVEETIGEIEDKIAYSTLLFIDVTEVDEFNKNSKGKSIIVNKMNIIFVR